MDDALSALRTDVATCQAIENSLRGRPPGSEPRARTSKAARKDSAGAAIPTRDVQELLETCIGACRASRKRHQESATPPDDTSDHGLSQYTRFTDQISLDVYKQFLHYVPRLVNVVRARPHHAHPPALALLTVFWCVLCR